MMECLIAIRTILRLPALEKDLSDRPSELLLAKLAAVGEILGDRSPQGPAQRVIELLAWVDRQMPRTGSGSQVSHEEFSDLCRQDARALACARELSAELQQRSIELYRALRGERTLYLPRSPTGTSGDGESLSAADQADIADFCCFLCYVLEKIMHEFWQGIPTDDRHGLTERVGTTLGDAVLEGLLVGFLHHRFPAMVMPADAEVESSRATTAQALEIVRRQTDRKHTLICQVYRLVESLRDAARAVPVLGPRGELRRTGPFLEGVLDNLQRCIRRWACLMMLSNCVHAPRRTTRTAVQPGVFAHPLPDLCMMHWVERRGHDQAWKLYVTGVQCLHGLGTGIASVALMRDSFGNGFGGHVGMLAPGDAPRFGCGTQLPVSELLHPESPVCMVADFLARQADRDVLGMMRLLKELGLEEPVRAAAGAIRRLDFLHCRREVRRRWLFWRRRVEDFTCLIMGRQDAARLGILDEVCVLPTDLQTLMRDQLQYCPEDPVALRFDYDDDGDDGPDEEAPPDPGPLRDSERREESSGVGDPAVTGAWR